jgi:hypothetical protein
MVKLKKSASSGLVLVVLALLVVLSFVPLARAQVTYSVSKDWVRVEVNTDSSINVLYNITYTYLSGSPQGIFAVGMPTSGYQAQYAQDQSGAALDYGPSAVVTPGIDVLMKQPIVLNQPYSFVVDAVVPSMVFPDTTNPGNAGLQFYPSTFDSASGTEDLRLEIVLPTGVGTADVKSPTNLNFDNVFVDQNQTAVFWERTAWAPGDTFRAGVSFPEQFVSPPPVTSPPFTFAPGGGGGSSDAVYAVFGGIAFLFVAIVIVAIFVRIAKAAYVKPSLSVESLGANRTLTAVEAGLVMGLKPVRVLTMMLYGLLFKRMVTVTETTPILKLMKVDAPQGEAGNHRSSPRYYEIDFLSAIKPDGTLDEAALARTYQGLVNNVNQRLKGYSRDDTVNYYKSIVDTAWKQVSQAGTSELMGDALDKNLDWLLADDKFDNRFATVFPSNIIIYPNPLWWWYWGGPVTPGQVGPSIGKTPSAPSGPAKPVALPGQDFANNVVHGLQGASNGLVKNMQDFANKLVPFQSQAPDRSGSVNNKPSCVCACHSCACACACVSCACACAGGGGR